MASGNWLAVDWTMIDNEEAFDDIEAAERDWIAVQLPIPVNSVLDAQVLHRVMRILRELAAMDMPDGLTVRGARSRRRIRAGRDHCVRSAGGGLAGVAPADRIARGGSALGPGKQGESDYRAHDAPGEAAAARNRLRALHAGDGHAPR